MIKYGILVSFLMVFFTQSTSGQVGIVEVLNEGFVYPPPGGDRVPIYDHPNKFELCENRAARGECRPTFYLPRGSRVEIRSTFYEEREEGRRVLHYQVHAPGSSDVGYVLPDYLLEHGDISFCTNEGYQGNYQNSIKPILNKILQEESTRRQIATDNLATSIDMSEHSSACQSFIDPNGNIGRLGRRLLEAQRVVDQAFAAEKGRSCFTEIIDLSPLCPRYENFGDHKRDQFWAYFYASLAHDESSCEERASNLEAKNDTGSGLFQLEFSWQQRVDAGRDKNFCKAQRMNLWPNGIVQEGYPEFDLGFQSECTASMMADIYCTNHRCPSSEKCEFSGTTSYWHGLEAYQSSEPESEDVQLLVKKFPGCFDEEQ